MPTIRADIKHPKNAGGNRRDVPPVFFASGLAQGRLLKTVELKITDTTNVKKSEFRLLDFRHAKVGIKGFKYRWTAIVSVEPTDVTKEADFTLTATPKELEGTPHVDTDSVDLRVPKNSKVVKGPKREPTITSPGQDAYSLNNDEQESFSVYGDTDCPIVSATLGGVDANYVMWVNELGYYCAQFLYLGTNPGPGEYDLVVTNTSGPSAPRSVVIA